MEEIEIIDEWTVQSGKDILCDISDLLLAIEGKEIVGSCEGDIIQIDPWPVVEYTVPVMIMNKEDNK